VSAFEGNCPDQGLNHERAKVAMGIKGSVEAGGFFFTASDNSKNISVSGIDSDRSHLASIRNRGFLDELFQVDVEAENQLR
jgi:hypothetical protein